MMPPLLLTASGLTPLQLAVREHFQQGGSVATIVIGVIAAFLALVALYQLLKRRQAGVESVRIDDPQRLFKDLLHAIEMPLQQRRLLTRVARDLRLAHPSVLLLSAELFDRYLLQWQSGQGGSGIDQGHGMPALAAAARRSLFRES
jgi:hypothetical protein